MAIDYTIAAIPTIYGGRQYRSRLEARWAAFFDVLRIPAEYEPADLGKWSPDFLIRGTEYPTLVEVKPLSAFDEEIATKMEACARAANFDGDLLLLGTSPFPVADGLVALGWWSTTRLSMPDRSVWVDGITAMVGSGRRIGASHQFDPLINSERVASLGAVVTAAWSVACNMVQWRPSNV